MADQGSQGVFSPFLRKQRIAAAAPHLRGNVLDIGCGGGQLARLVPASRYVGLDISVEALDQARRAYPDHEFVTAIPSGRRFDTIAALAVIEHVKQPHSFLGTLADLLNEDGQIVLTTPHPAFRKVHDFGAMLGLFSRDASEEHEAFLNHQDIAAYSRRSGLVLKVSRRFLGGANQLFVLAGPGA
jgi:2-polyprenyl-3-methyl-5-hydroxy-6-metoxy-1,4-benzoquinol methylase